MDAGKRDRLITIQRGTASTDDYGGETKTWATLGQVWARVRYGTGQERREAAQEAGSQAATFECLYNPTIAGADLKDRIQFDATDWDIVSRALIGLNREIHFTAVRAA